MSMLKVSCTQPGSKNTNLKTNPKFIANRNLTTESTKNFFTHTNPFTNIKSEPGNPYPSSSSINYKKIKDISDKIKISTDAEHVEYIPKFNTHSHYKNVLENHYKNDSPFSNKFRITKNVYNNLSNTAPCNEIYLTQYLQSDEVNNASTNLFPGVEILDDQAEREVIDATLDQSTDSVEPIDCLEEQKLTMGTAAVTDFYRHHKIVDKVIDQNKFMSKEGE